ncbi:MAG: flavodoxin family protein [Eubacteriales bacterium]|nr:flavodoxin family protein [Eubacteriales bacterium]
MKKNFLVLVGSPRKGGNTDALADALIEGALESGHTVEKLTLQNYNIHGCLGCDYCMRNHGACVQSDDMQRIYDKLDHADVVVLATPLYFFGFSSQMKAFVDRCYALLSRTLPQKQSILLAVCGSQDDHEMDGLIAQYRMIAAALHWSNRGEVSAKGVLKKGDISGHAALEEARELGRSVAVRERKKPF